MRKLILLSSFLWVMAEITVAQQQDSAPATPAVVDCFKAMPDSLLPYLSANNRLDMIDFMEAHMKAEVTNLLDGKSEMTHLSTDSISIRVSPVLSVELKLLPVEEAVDSAGYQVQLKRTYRLNENQTECIVDVYTSVWRRLSSAVEISSLLRRDDKLSM